MSSQGGSDLGKNAVLCYFPTLPYYLRYQIAFDIVVKHSEGHADASVAGESQRLIHVELFFPDGFICNPAPSGEMAHTPELGNAVHSHFRPPQFPQGPHFDRHHPMHFEGPIMSEDNRHVRMFANVVNGQPGEFIAIDDKPYDIIRQCSTCRGFHSGEERIHNQPSQGIPKPLLSQQAEEQPGNSRQHPSTSGITDQSGTSDATPPKAGEQVATDRSQTDTSHASPDTASALLVTDRKNQETTYSIKLIRGDLKIVTAEGLYGTEGEKLTISILGTKSTANYVSLAMDILDMVRQINDDEDPEDKKKTSADPNVDNDK